MAVDPAASFGQSAKILHSEGWSLISPMFLFLKQIGGSLGVRLAPTTRKPELWKSLTM
jgi:hypothetical protein